MWVRGLVVASLLWVAALAGAPLAIAASRPALSIGAAVVFAAGSRICHQRPDRCFWIRGRPMPVCARCTGLYVSAALAAPLALLVPMAFSGRRARGLVGIAAAPTLVTWSLEMAGLAHPSNVVRFGAALPLGFAAAWLVISTLSDGPRPVRHAHKHHEDAPAS